MRPWHFSKLKKTKPAGLGSQGSGIDLRVLFRQVPKDEALKDIPKEREEELKKWISFVPSSVSRNVRIILCHRRLVSSIWTSQRDIPRQLLHILSKLESGELGLHFHLDKLARLVNTLDNSSNRLTTGIIFAALIVGSSMIITSGVGPFIFGFPALGVIGYLISTVLGLWLVIRILHTKKY